MSSTYTYADALASAEKIHWRVEDLIGGSGRRGASRARAVSDAQVPDDITITFTQAAGDAATLGGLPAHEIAESGSFMPSVDTVFLVPAAEFHYVRTGSRVRVTGVLALEGPAVLPVTGTLRGLPLRTSDFMSASDAVGLAGAALTDGFDPRPVTASVAAVVASGGVRVTLLPLANPVVEGGPVSVDFSYDLDP